MPAHSVLELLIQSTTLEGEYRLVAEWSPRGGLPIRRERGFRLDDAMLDAMGDPTRYGALLGRALFEGGVRELFAQARQGDAMLRVLLAVEARAVQSLRWERLAGPFDDDQWLLLGHSQRTPFSLYLPSASDRMFSPFGRRELRALVVIANPEPGNQYGVDPFDEAEAVRTVLAGLGEIPSVVLGKQPGAAGPPTLGEICRRLTDERFTLLHVICHGAFSSRTGETALFLDGDDGKTEAVKATAMIQRMRELGGARGLPHLAFLGVCDSARPDAETVLGGLGQRLVRELGMPAVVAMTERVSQATAFALGQVLYARLREHGEVDRALVEACVEVRGRGDAVVPALFSRLAGRPLFSDDMDRAPTAAEIAAAASRLEALIGERAPVLRERAMALVSVVNVDPATLAGPAVAERERALAELEQLCEGALELSFSALAHGRDPAPYGVSCPFPGLRAFTADQRKFFRGRTVLVDALLAQLEREPFLAVVGGSGCGKSSLVLAGVIPRLRDADPDLKIAQLAPGDHPLAKLEAALQALEGAPSAVLYVDQFEEAFTLCRDEVERRTFFDRLLAAVSPSRRVIMSMRADFLGECAAHEGLRRRVEGLRLVPPMSADELRNAIEEQGKAAGLRYETGLCELILDDVRDEPGAMPLLQHALRELYERRHGRWLRLAAYEELGRVQQAIGRTAEKVWERLEPRDRERLRMVLLYLTEVREAEAGGPMRYLRRRASLVHLYTAVAGDDRELERLVDALADERLLVKSRDAQAGDVVEVAHEALLRSWPRLQEWLTAANDALRLRQDLESAAAGWRANERATAYLEHLHERGDVVRSSMRTGALMLDPSLREYFDACEVEEQRQEQEKERRHQEKLATMEALATEQARRVRNLRIATLATAVALLLVGAGVLYAVRSATKADEDAKRAQTATEEAEAASRAAHASAAVEARAKVKAEHQRDVAKSATKLAHARALVDEDPTHALLLLQQLPLHDTPEWRQLALQALGHPMTIAVLRHENIVHSAKFSADGTRVLTVSPGDHARVWSTDGSAPRVLSELGHVVDASFGGPDGSEVAAISSDGTLRVTSTNGEAAPRILGRHDARVSSVSLSHDGRHVAIASGDGKAYIWSTSDGEPRAPEQLVGHLYSVDGVSFSSDGRRVVTASADWTARVWNAENTDTLRILAGHYAVVRSASFSSDGRRVVTASYDFSARVWDASTGALQTTLWHPNLVHAASFSPDGAQVVTASEDGAARVWNASGTGLPLLLRGHTSAVVDARFAPDGTRVVTASRDGTARIWSVTADRVPRAVASDRVEEQPRPRSPDGTRELVVIEQQVELRRADGSAPLRLRGHRGVVLSASFSADGTRMVTASTDGSVRVWTADGDLVVALPPIGGEVMRASLHPDGRSVVVLTKDGKAYEWPLEVETLDRLASVATGLCLPPEARMEYLEEEPEQACEAFSACEREHGRPGGCTELGLP